MGSLDHHISCICNQVSVLFLQNCPCSGEIGGPEKYLESSLFFIIMTSLRGTGDSLAIGSVACNLLPIYLSKFVIKAGYIALM